ncbi:Receptor-type tyrosine-protein phosphatase beta,Tyrosine-protein phosphatase non-receptor type 1,Receptor-type tyrosine-protein phosphatase R [Mytilus coruscus]|uniref:protein-tyrosine-phosphatase n=1 Tax=Mytilus coruscus TaxID=42192 RepID=A0A6J8BBD9_MYTCO|nr:Receptor-type tyrosine-protein phosphatase beta,Tyrosine-protein phosphatase non-receptor type 1,Receptor-type tyrosine-protein phosphatase R [Mytilus coruscus]
MDNFSLVLTNGSTVYDKLAVICYKDSEPGLPNITQDIACNMPAKQFFFFNKRETTYAYVELCYIEIHGCWYGFWGANCAKPCSTKCVHKLCLPGNGFCVFGCDSHYCQAGRCNADTSCTTGCVKGRAGTYCTHHNVAYNGTAKQHPFYPTANLSIDGERTSCTTLTTAKSSSYLQIDMGYFTVITAVHLTIGDETPSVSNHTLYCSNTTDSWTEATQLYHGIHLFKDIEVFGFCKYVIYLPPILNENSKINLCEIEIGGCPSKNYGENCELSCPENCYGPCNLTTGDCLFGCSDGWLDKKCDIVCRDGTFGGRCLRNCSKNCVSPPCNHTTGECEGGCVKGWEGFNCTKECSIGKFGFNCTESCDGCINNGCNRFNGVCLNNSGCKPGYEYGLYCNKTCADWHFGTNCTKKCYCLNDPCDKFNGNCRKGCKEGWEGIACDEVYQEPAPSNPGPAIGGGISAAFIVIILAVVAIVIFRRRSPSKHESYLDNSQQSNLSGENLHANPEREQHINKGCVSDADDLYVSVDKKYRRASISEVTTEIQVENGLDDETNVYNNVASVQSVNKYKILVGDLKKVIDEKKRNEGFKKEYESYYNEKAYIASQGPKKNSVRDFWHMIWQEQVGKIVMVTQLEENRRNKCAQYWPQTVNKSMVIENYRLTMKEETYHTVYVYRLITVYEKTTQRERNIHHFHFIQWPDHGVPDSINLVNFYRKVASEQHDQSGPMVVHCSAGVGRTGTFIAVDALYEHGKKVGSVDVMEYVQMMRKDRMNMIQTYEQYEVVFEALLELFTVPETSIPRDNFCGYIEQQENKRLPQNQTMYRQEFQKLQTLKPSYRPAEYSAARSRENTPKNSSKNVYPHDNYRPYLMSFGKTRNDYINAVIVPGYSAESKFLVTQCPLVETVVDFWTMVYDHSSTIVVLLDPVNKNAPLWVDEKDKLEFDQFSVVKDKASLQCELKLSLNHKTNKERKSITVFTASEWTANTDFPSSPEYMLDLVQRVINCWEINKGPITVVCSDGCSKSGLFVALRLAFEKMQMDDEVDVFQVVRAIQIRRPEFLSEFDQYEYCYKCIKTLLEGESRDSLYANY